MKLVNSSIIEYVPDSVELPEFISETSDKVNLNSAQKKINTFQNGSNSNQIPGLLNEEEAKLIDESIDNLINRIKNLNSKIGGIRDQINDEAKDSVLSINFNLEDKPSLKRAIKNVFGYTSETITYNMYIEACNKLRELEKSEVDKYMMEPK